MEEFTFIVQHRSRAKHQNADALSRYPVRSAEEETTTVSADEDAVTRAIHRGSGDDPDFGASSKPPPHFPMTVTLILVPVRSLRLIFL